MDITILGVEWFGRHHPVLKCVGVLRLLRILRPFKLSKYAKYFRGAQIIIQTVIDSIPDMTNISLLVVLVMYVWAVVGTTLFADAAPKYFGSIGYSYFSLFVAVTQIGWISDFVELEEKEKFDEAAIYYASFLFIGVFIVAKVIMAVLVANLEEKYRELDDAKRKRTHRLKTHQQQQSGIYMQQVQPPPPKADPIWKSQIPYELPVSFFHVEF